MKVIKHSGNIVDFNREKLKRSLFNSGASEMVVEDILQAIEKEIYEGIPTKKIYKYAFSLLKKAANVHAARYNLRAALQLLGPAGFFFEKFIARLFDSDNYETRTNIVLHGKCVSHEIDILIKKENEIKMVECKFHSNRDVRSDVKVPMYILSRYNDIKDNRHSVYSINDDVISKCLIVTNNRFTSEAEKFAECSGIELLSWDYPERNNIRAKIDNKCLYPVTCLTTLTLAEKNKLLILDVILVSEIISNRDSLNKIGLSSKRINNVLKESSGLCKLI
jgi:hypothetical protein